MTTTTTSFFNDYAAALLTFSAEKISGFYQTPLAIYSDQGIQLVKQDAEVLAFWKEGVKPYQEMNIDKAIPTIIQEEQLSQTILTSKVHWKNYDKHGKEIAQETNFYILSHTKEGIKISGLILMQTT